MLIDIAYPMPDELANGQLESIHRLNGLHSLGRTVHWLIEQARNSDSSTENPSTVEALAFASRMQVPNYVRAHTLIPYARFVRPASSEPEEHGHPASSGLMARFGMRYVREAIYLCDACIAAERKSRRVSPYLHRTHQLPGVDWCPRHGNPLYAYQLPSIFSKAPGLSVGQLFEQAKPSRTAEGQLSDSELRTVRRFVAISSAMLELPRCLPAGTFVETLQQRLKGSGIRYSKGRAGIKSKNTLSDIALQSLPHEWLERILPGISRRRKAEFFGPLDGALLFRKARLSSAAYAVALCLAYPSAKAAIDSIQSMLAAPVPEENPASKLPPGFWDSDEAYALYCKLKGDRAAIARTLGLSPTTVGSALAVRGLPAIGNSSPLGRALALHFQGKPIALAAYEQSVDEAELTRMVERGGTRLRSAIMRFGRATTARQARNANANANANANSTIKNRKDSS